MGNACINKGSFGKKNMQVVMLGLDGAGKTTILYKLRLGEILKTIPTIGFNVETVEYMNINFTVWDIGGQDKIRPLWRHYLSDKKALIFVVDSNDRERVDLAKEELHQVLQSDDLDGAVLLVLASKQGLKTNSQRIESYIDLPNAMKVEELSDKLDLISIRRSWYIQATCATSGDGLYEGLNWLSHALKKS